jgi:putative addiction module antidote
MTTLKLTQIGNSLGVVLPKELLAKLKVGKGDSLFVIDAAQGVTLTPYDPEFERQIAVARQISRKRRDVLRVLAK